MSSKRSIRFYNDHKVRAVWSEEENKWYFSVLDIIGAINEQDDYQKKSKLLEIPKNKVTETAK